MEELFTPDCVYTESWGPEYCGVESVRHWFEEWNTRARVITWEIKRIDHADDRSYVEWLFEDCLNDGRVEKFEGISVIEWQGARIARRPARAAGPFGLPRAGADRAPDGKFPCLQTRPDVIE